MIAAVLFVLLATPPAAPEPVAVMPFKNLSGDAALDWMSGGIADTMISDLRRSKVAVVERDQIARALGEILAQSAAGQPERDARGAGWPHGGEAPGNSAESTATKVGKLVGARTVVVGGYQQAGKQLRINARFVDVETGVVKEAAKSTGSSSDPFSVQDQVVDQLLGRSSAARPARKTTAKTPDAYRLYAQAGAVATDAERAPLLRKAMELDPGFVYAADALAALERRLAAMAEARDKDKVAYEAALRAIAFDEKLPNEKRAPAANDLLNSMMHGRRFHRLVADATRLSGTNLTLPIANYAIAEAADFAVFHGNSSLKRLDLSLQAGEQFLKRHPRSNYAPSVQVVLKMDLDEKKARADAPAKQEAALRALFAKESALAAGDPRRADVESDICALAAQHKLHELAVTRCLAVYERWSSDTRPRVKELAHRAGTHVAFARWQLGRTVDARAFAHELLAVVPPDGVDAVSVRGLVSTLPTDSPEDAR